MQIPQSSGFNQFSRETTLSQCLWHTPCFRLLASLRPVTPGVMHKWGICTKTMHAPFPTINWYLQKQNVIWFSDEKKVYAYFWLCTYTQLESWIYAGFYSSGVWSTSMFKAAVPRQMDFSWARLEAFVSMERWEGGLCVIHLHLQF